MRRIPILIAFLFSLHIYAQDTLVIPPAVLKVADTSLVFTPHGMKSGQKVPMVIMLHGYGGDFHQFPQLLDLQNYADAYGFLIVTPDGFKDSWYFNAPSPSQMQWESFFIKDLYPTLLEKYAVDSSKIFITGLSMGGHGAMYLFLRHSGLFCAAASSSGVLDLNYSGQKYHSLSNILGEYQSHKDVFSQYSPINQLDSIKFSPKKIFIDCGNKDHLLEANRKFYDKCTALFIDAEFLQMSGRHNRAYWKKSFPFHFEFFKRQLNTVKN